VLPGYERWAEEDIALPYINQSTISAPNVVKRMLELLDPKPHHKVLEVGTGSGYSTCLLSRLVDKVISIEVDPEVAQAAQRNLERCGAKNVKVLVGDGKEGYPPEAPYDRILINAAFPTIPPKLLEQLKEDGILVMPLGPEGYQRLIRYSKKEGIKEDMAVVFIPLR